jgi:TadE-like protein
MVLILFGVVEVARVFYVYHTLQKALRGGAALLSRSTNVEYCNPSDLTMEDVRNFIVYGNLQGQGTAVVQGLTTDMIQILPERGVVGSTSVVECSCAEEPENPETCNVATGGRSPDFMVIHLGSGFPLSITFPYVALGTINLRVSVRMPVTGG